MLICVGRERENLYASRIVRVILVRGPREPTNRSEQCQLCARAMLRGAKKKNLTTLPELYVSSFDTFRKVRQRKASPKGNTDWIAENLGLTLICQSVKTFASPVAKFGVLHSTRTEKQTNPPTRRLHAEDPKGFQPMW